MGLDVISEAISAFGTVCTILLFGAPVLTIQKIFRQRSVGDFSSATYVCTFFQCSLWIGYCLVTPDRAALLVTNVAGASLALTWCLCFLRFCEQKASLSLQLAAAACSILGIFVLDTRWFANLSLQPLKHGETLRTEGLGVTCVIFNILMYASPLSVAKHVIRTRSVSSMPLPLSVMTFVCAVTWTTYGILVMDPWVMIPNIFGVVLGTCQLLLYHFISAAQTRELPLSSQMVCPAPEQ